MQKVMQPYRQDIDGLRGLAVLFVVIFHAFPSYLSGGFIGVDVFFVISGYLITSILLGDISSGTFKLADFYLRRIRRIFPALTLLLFVVLILGWIFLLPQEFVEQGAYVAGGAIFIDNFIAIKDAGYFDTSSDFKTLLHLWSLGIEEQFYILWPFLILLISKTKYKICFFIFLITISFTYNLAIIKASPIECFYLPFTRFWELSAGGLLAYLKMFRGFNIPTKNKYYNFFENFIGPLIGSIFLIFGALFLSKNNPYPGFYGLIPVVGTLLVINGNIHGPIHRLIYLNKILIYIGLISYPLYLWHWPLLSFARIVGDEEAHNYLFAMMILISFFLAYLTYKYIELPIRYSGLNKKLLLFTASLLMLVGVVGFFSKHLISMRDNTLFKDIENVKKDWNYPGDLVEVKFDGGSYFKSDLLDPKILFLGDSHMEQFGPIISRLTKEDRLPSSIFYTQGGCPPIPGFIRKGNGCRNYIADVENLLNKYPSISEIVISACWNCYFIDAIKAGGKNDGLYYLYKDNEKLTINSTQSKEIAYNFFSNYIFHLKDKYLITVILDNPKSIFFDPTTIARGRMNGRDDYGLATLSEDQAALNDEMKLFLHSRGIKYVDQLAILCNPNHMCRTLDNDGRPIYKDDGHLNAGSVLTVFSKFNELIGYNKTD